MHPARAPQQPASAAQLHMANSIRRARRAVEMVNSEIGQSPLVVVDIGRQSAARSAKLAAEMQENTRLACDSARKVRSLLLEIDRSLDPEGSKIVQDCTKFSVEHLLQLNDEDRREALAALHSVESIVITPPPMASSPSSASPRAGGGRAGAERDEDAEPRVPSRSASAASEGFRSQRDRSRTPGAVAVAGDATLNSTASRTRSGLLMRSTSSALSPTSSMVAPGRSAAAGCDGDSETNPISMSDDAEVASPTSNVDVSFESASGTRRSGGGGGGGVDLFQVDETQARRLARQKERAVAEAVDGRGGGARAGNHFNNNDNGGGDSELHGVAEGYGDDDTDDVQVVTGRRRDAGNAGQASATDKKKKLARQSKIDELVSLSRESLKGVEDTLGLLQKLESSLHGMQRQMKHLSAAVSKDPGLSALKSTLHVCTSTVEHLFAANEGLYGVVSDVSQRLGVIDSELEARDTALGPLQSMLRVAKEELLFTAQQRDEYKRELVLHRVGSRLRALVKRGRELRGEEYGIVSSAGISSSFSAAASGQAATATSIVSPGLGGTAAFRRDSRAAPRTRATRVVAVGGGGGHSEDTGSHDADSEHRALVNGGSTFNVSAAHLTSPGTLTPALRRQGAAMARNAFRMVPPRRGASAADVEKAEAELTHCIANVDVIMGTVVHVCIADYHVLWETMPSVMRPSVQLFNTTVERVAQLFDASALVYRSRGSVSFAPHGGYHMILFRHPHDAVHFAATLHCALLLVPWPQQLVDLTFSRDNGGDGAPEFDDTITTQVDIPELVPSSKPPRLSTSITTASSTSGSGSSRHPALHFDPSEPPAADENDNIPRTPEAVAGTVRIDRANIVGTLLQHSPLWRGHVPIPPRSAVDMLVKDMEQFELRCSAQTTTSMEFGSAVVIAERLSAQVAIGPARVHALFEEPILFRGLRAKIGIHTGVVFVEGSIKDATVMSATEETDPSDTAYSFRPTAGRSTMQATVRDTGRKSITATLGMEPASPSSGSLRGKPGGDNGDSPDVFFGTVNAKVPLVFGTAAMKASLLCGVASGGETVISQQTHSVLHSALDSWGLFSRPTSYLASSPRFAGAVPVVNDLMYSLVEPGEVTYSILPRHFLHRALFFPSSGSRSLYNPTWWLPFHPAHDHSSVSEPASLVCSLKDVEHRRRMHCVPQYSLREGAVLARRVEQLEAALRRSSEFVTAAAARAKKAVERQEAWERNQMALHDGCAMLHVINLVSERVGDMSASALLQPVELLRETFRRVASPKLFSLHPTAALRYAEQLSLPQFRSILFYLSSPGESKPASENAGLGTSTTAAAPTPAMATENASSLLSTEIQHAVSRRSHSLGSRADVVATLPHVFVTFGLIADALQHIQHALKCMEGAEAVTCDPETSSSRRASALRAEGVGAEATLEGTLSLPLDAISNELDGGERQKFGRSADEDEQRRQQQSASVRREVVALQEAVEELRQMNFFIAAQIEALWTQRWAAMPAGRQPLSANPTMRGSNSNANSTTNVLVVGRVDDKVLESHFIALAAVQLLMDFVLATFECSRRKDGSVAHVYPSILDWNSFVERSVARLRLTLTTTTSPSPWMFESGVTASVDPETVPGVVVALSPPQLARAFRGQLISTLVVSPTVWLKEHRSLLLTSYPDVFQLILQTLRSAPLANNNATTGISSTPLNSSSGVKPLSGFAGSGASPPGASPASGSLAASSKVANLSPPAEIFLDTALLDRDAQIIGQSKFGDFRVTALSWSGAKRSAFDAVLQQCQHASSGAQWIGITVLCEQPSFPNAGLRDPRRTDEDALHLPQLVRKSCRRLVDALAVCGREASRLCPYLFPLSGVLDHDVRVFSGGGGNATTTTASVGTGVALTLLYSDTLLSSGEIGGPSTAAMTLDAIRRRYFLETSASSADADVSVSHHRFVPTWTVNQVESWSLSVALAVNAIHDVGCASGGVTPWTIMARSGGDGPEGYDASAASLGSMQHRSSSFHAQAESSLSSTAAAAFGYGHEAFLLQDASFVLWKLIVSRTVGHDAAACLLRGDSLPSAVSAENEGLQSSSSTTTTKGTATSPRRQPSTVGGSSPRRANHSNASGTTSSLNAATNGGSKANASLQHLPQVAMDELLEWMPPEALRTIATMVEDDNPLNHPSALLAAIVSGSLVGVAQRGPFDEPLDMAKMDVYMFGALLWYLATAGASLYGWWRMRRSTDPSHPLHASSPNAPMLSDADAPAYRTASKYLGWIDNATAAAAAAANNNNTMASAGSTTVEQVLVQPDGPGGFAMLSQNYSTSFFAATLRPPAASRGTLAAATSALAPATSPTTMSNLRGASFTAAAPPEGTVSADGGQDANTISVNSSSGNIFGTTANLVRHLRIALESKAALRAAPYHASSLWPPTTAAASVRMAHGASSSVDPQRFALAMEQELKELHAVSFTLLCDLLDKTLQRDPARRPTMKEVLEHPFFFSVPKKVVPATLFGSSGVVRIAAPQYVAFGSSCLPVLHAAAHANSHHPSATLSTAAGVDKANSASAVAVPTAQEMQPVQSELPSTATEADVAPDELDHFSPQVRRSVLSSHFGGVQAFSVATVLEGPTSINSSAKLRGGRGSGDTSGISSAAVPPDVLSWIGTQGPVFQRLDADTATGPLPTMPLSASSLVQQQQQRQQSAQQRAANITFSQTRALLDGNRSRFLSASMSLVSLKFDVVSALRRSAAVLRVGNEDRPRRASGGGERGRNRGGEPNDAEDDESAAAAAAVAELLAATSPRTPALTLRGELGPTVLSLLQCDDDREYQE